MYDIRPYFTIHDQDHAALVNKLPPKAGILIGVTNPFIERSCKHWPHVLTLGRTSQCVPFINYCYTYAKSRVEPVPLPKVYSLSQWLGLLRVGRLKLTNDTHPRTDIY